MALNEGVIMSENEINNFVHPIKPDIRQSILQLQYIISTGEINSVIFAIVNLFNCADFIFDQFIKNIYSENGKQHS